MSKSRLNLTKVSLGCNVVLLASCAWLFATHSSPQLQKAPATVQSPSKSALVTAPTPVPFSWSQVEASDYPTYIKNLRAIGCPEQTIRDIITADVASLYQDKRQEVLSNAHSAPAAASSTNAVQAQLNQLKSQQTALISDLLPPQQPSSGQTSTAPSAANYSASNSAGFQPQIQQSSRPTFASSIVTTVQATSGGFAPATTAAPASHSNAPTSSGEPGNAVPAGAQNQVVANPVSSGNPSQSGNGNSVPRALRGPSLSDQINRAKYGWGWSNYHQGL